jgi:hypothetical protein
VKLTGEPSVRCIEMLVTRSLPHAWQLTPARAPRWVREPSGAWTVALARAMELSRRKRVRTGDGLFFGTCPGNLERSGAIRTNKDESPG